MYFHVCTDGPHNGIIHFDDLDYRQAVILSVLSAFTNEVCILAYAHMSSHSHFVIRCQTADHAKSFGEWYKREYAKYAGRRHDAYKLLNGIDCTPIAITSRSYLCNCISYTLMNPVVAGVVKFPEEYRWSSFSAYFKNCRIQGKSVSELSVRDLRKTFHTHIAIKELPLWIDESGCLIPQSVVDFQAVEKLFGSQTSFFKSLALTDSVREEEIYNKGIVTYNDNDLLLEVESLAMRRFSKKSVHQLTKYEKNAIITSLIRRSHCTPKRIARVLRLDPDEVARLLGRTDSFDL